MINLRYIEGRANFVFCFEGMKYKPTQNLNESFLEFKTRIFKLYPQIFEMVNWSGCIETVKKEKMEEIKSKISHKERFFDVVTKRFPNLDFSEFEYVNSKMKGIVKCSIHGKFEITPMNLKYETCSGCPKCVKEKYRVEIHKIVCSSSFREANKFILGVLKNV
jgi:hypothetical protein